MTSMLKYYQLRKYRIMGVIFKHFRCTESDFRLILFILSTLRSWRSWPPWWNISNSVDIWSWVSFLGILSVLNPISSSLFILPTLTSWRSWKSWVMVRYQQLVNLGSWVSFSGILGVLIPISRSDYLFVDLKVIEVMTESDFELRLLILSTLRS